MNKREAIDELAWLDNGGVAVGVQVGNGVGDGSIWYAARTMQEARNWVAFQEGYIVPGTRTQFVARTFAEG